MDNFSVQNKIGNMFFPTLLIVVSLQGCGSSDINLVKSGVMDFNKTLTIGQAFDNWQNCSKSSWSDFKSSNGQRVVQFTCENKNVKQYFSKLKEIYCSKEEMKCKKGPEDMRRCFDVESITDSFQWTINTDNTFQLVNTTIDVRYKDGKSYIAHYDILYSVYSNEFVHNNEIFNVDFSVNQPLAEGILLAVLSCGMAK